MNWNRHHFRDRGGPFERGWAGGYRRLPFYDRTLNQNYYGDLFYAIGAYGNGPYDMFPPKQNITCWLYGGACPGGRCKSSIYYDTLCPPY